jgi:hypothetical protein
MNQVLSTLALSSLCLLLTSCTLPAPSGPRLRAADFGTSPYAQQRLGIGMGEQAVIPWFGPTQSRQLADGSSARLVNIQDAMNTLRRTAHGLPRSSRERELLRQTYDRLYFIYRTRRDTMMSQPFPYGRGGMARMNILPPMPPEI